MTEPAARHIPHKAEPHVDPFRPPKWLQRVALAVAGVFLFALLGSVSENSRKAALAMESPIQFPSALQTDKAKYRPGGTLRLFYTRVTTEPEFLVLLVESFENLATGEVYPGPLIGRGSGLPGQQKARSVRIVPRELPDGIYVLEGWALPQTSRRSLPSRYVSKPFEVSRD